MEKRTVVVSNSTGVHMRPSGLIAKTAGRYESQIKLWKNGNSVNAKSIMGVLMLAAAPNEFIDIEAEGPDEKEAVAAIEKLFIDKFGEWSLYE